MYWWSILKFFNMLKGDYKFRLGISFYCDFGFIMLGRGEYIDFVIVVVKMLWNSDIM